jgi:AcrR family transcriptional regulator
MATASTSRAPALPTSQDSRFDRRLAQILDYATEVFARKGYEGASMRDLSRLSGISLAGLYYYFDSKEKLLYFIQKHTFTTIIDQLRKRLEASDDPEERIRIFVHNHVEYAVARQKAMTVLSHEDDVLKEDYGAELATIKREYYHICVGLVDDLARAEKLKPLSAPDGSRSNLRTRTAVMGLFGMMNWLYTWYNPRVDPDADTLAEELSDLFLQGVRAAMTASGKVRGGLRNSSQPRSLARPQKGSPVRKRG